VILYHIANVLREIMIIDKKYVLFNLCLNVINFMILIKSVELDVVLVKLVVAIVMGQVRFAPVVKAQII
jgi:hypothetical protein